MFAKYFVVAVISIVLLSCKEDSATSPITETTKSSPPIEYFYPVPSPSQLEWQDGELAMFIHFGINTFYEQEWGNGTEDPKMFEPKRLDAEQWVKLAKEVGFKYVILTAKHHDGFCLWPSKYTTHTIANSPYKNGQGDVVREFADACHKHGIKFGFYLSPWDRHEPTYGSDAYNIFFQNQLIELLTNYGEVGEVWFDGASDGTSKQVYNWDLYFATVRYYQPNAVIAIAGPDVRWVGNEEGLGFETEWSSQPRAFSIQPATPDGKVWYPSECDVSIRPSWFYYKREDSLVKSTSKLVEIYFKSVGRNSNLLLNVPPNKDGLISDFDVQRLRDWRQTLDRIFARDLFAGQQIESSNTRNSSEHYSPKNCVDGNRKTFWVTDKDTTKAELTIKLSQKEKINIIRLEEAIEFGQRIKAFEILAEVDGNWAKIFEGTTIGRSRIFTFKGITTDKVKIVIKDSYASPTLRVIKGYYSDYVN